MVFTAISVNGMVQNSLYINDVYHLAEFVIKPGKRFDVIVFEAPS